jgi:uncharacterized damage-inducible protein DinB
MKTIRSMMEHMYWANGLLTEGMAQQSVAHTDALTLLHHVASAEKIWLTRLEGKDSSGIVLWRSGELHELLHMVKQNEDAYKAYIGKLKEEELDTIVNYRNLSGQPFQSSVRDILTHVALHGQYHRGQINRILRLESLEPVPMDYMLFTRL